MATVQKRGQSYRITVSEGYDAHGKQVRRSMTWKPDPGMTERQIQKELERQKVLFEEKCKGGAGQLGMKFEPFARSWFTDYAEHQLRPRTVAFMHSLEARTYQAIGHLRMDRISALQIQEFIKNLAETGVNQRTGGGLSLKTQHHYLSFISSVFEYGIRLDLLQDNPAKRVKIPRAELPEKRIYTMEQAQALLEAAASYSLAAEVFFTLAIYGGYRRGELLGLEWKKDIDFEAKTISVTRTSLYTKEKGVFTDTTKTKGSQRVLKFPSPIFELLHRYKVEQDKKREKLFDRWKEHDRLFTTWNGEPMCVSTPAKWMEKICRKAGLSYYGLHSLRHLNATLLINSGVDVRTVSASLGHSQTSTTLNIYAHTFAEVQARATESIATVLNLENKKGR